MIYSELSLNSNESSGSSSSKLSSDFIKKVLDITVMIIYKNNKYCIKNQKMKIYVIFQNVLNIFNW